METKPDAENLADPRATSSGRSNLVVNLPFGTRLQRVHSSHSYGFVLTLVLASFVFIALAPSDPWALGVVVLFETAILGLAIWTSGLVLRRLAVPMVLIAGGVTAAVQALDGGDSTRMGAGLVETTFLVATCAVIAEGVWDQQQINQQSILGALSIYMTIGILFTVVFGVMAKVGDGPFFAQGNDGSSADRLYFSFVTLATLGYGDYTAASELGRMLAVVEALVGQLYLVTVVALLVANLGRGKGPGPEGPP